MLTFTQFLTERFHSGVRADDGYAEVFVNPSTSEMAELSKWPSKAYHELGGIIVGSNLYVWDRSRAMHSDVRHKLGISFDRAIPLYLEYNHHDKSVDVALASFTQSMAQHYSADRIVEICRKHPAFKYFSRVEYR